MPDRPDPLTDALARFTPAARLDRDEVLFQAGRASAPKGRWWKRAAALLLVSNVVTLTAWFSTPPRQVVVIETRPVEPTELPPTESGQPVPPWTASARQTGELPPRPEGTDARFIGSKPLTIRSGLTSPSDI